MILIILGMIKGNYDQKNLDMNSASLIKKIELLPTDLIVRVDDFVDFLISKYEKGEDIDFDISEADKKELEIRLKKHYKNPTEGITIEDVKEEYRKRYGL